MFFDPLPMSWQTAVNQAWIAFQHQTVPIGACVLRPDGTILPIGRNHIKDSDDDGALLTNHPLAHAEINAHLAITDRSIDIHPVSFIHDSRTLPIMCGSGLYVWYSEDILCNSGSMGWQYQSFGYNSLSGYETCSCLLLFNP